MTATLKILCYLAEVGCIRESKKSEVFAELGISRSNAYKALAKLRQAGVVLVKDGKICVRDRDEVRVACDVVSRILKVAPRAVRADSK
jgi:DNA-binding transcriptional ArsR family regulator